MWGYLKKPPHVIRHPPHSMPRVSIHPAPCVIPRSPWEAKCHVLSCLEKVKLVSSEVAPFEVCLLQRTRVNLSLLQKSRLTHVSPYFSQKSRWHVSFSSLLKKSKWHMSFPASFRKTNDTCHPLLFSEKANATCHSLLSSEKASDTCHSLLISEKANATCHFLLSSEKARIQTFKPRLRWRKSWTLPFPSGLWRRHVSPFPPFPPSCHMSL